MIRDFFNDSEKITMSQQHRLLFEQLISLEPIKKANDKIQNNEYLKGKKISVGVVSSNQKLWEEMIVTRQDNIPFEFIGKGNQNLVKSFLTFENENFKNKGVILIEEPENHLSFSNLNIILTYIRNNLSNYQVLISTHNSYVLNKLGMNNVILFSKNSHMKIYDLPCDTINYFKKTTGYDTLRYILCKRAILVEGESDELIIQRAYLDKYGKLPIENGIDIICTSLAYKRYLDIGIKLNKETIVVTDNDGDPNILNTKFKEYQKPYFKICFPKTVILRKDSGFTEEKVPNVNTLEAELYRSNSLEKLSEIFGFIDAKGMCTKNAEDLVHYMITHKTECALSIFNSIVKINYPDYVLEAIENE